MAESLGNVFDTVVDHMQFALQQLEGDICSNSLYVLFANVLKEKLTPIEFGVAMVLVSLIKMCLNKSCNKVCKDTFIWCISCSKWSETRCSMAIAFQLRFQNATLGMHETHEKCVTNCYVKPEGKRPL